MLLNLDISKQLQNLNFNDPGEFLKNFWPKLAKMPGGKKLFSKLLGQFVPYSGTISAQCENLEPGYARMSLKQHRKISNHLKSIHAVALLNFAELTSGLALLYSLPPKQRGIITRLEIDYQKKARGKIFSEVKFDPSQLQDLEKMTLEISITDESQTVLARAKAYWQIGSTR